MRHFSAAVVGLGQIGQGYDYQVADKSLTLTHAAGFAAHPGFSLSAGIDPDPRQGQRFSAKYGVKAYATIGALLAEQRPEVFSLAAPTPLHHGMFLELIEARPLAILCEKPIAANVAEGREMVERAEQAGCALLVNYMRRFEPGVRHLKEAIEYGQFGKIYKGTVWYSKGFLNNASHFIDLLQYFFGSMTDFKVISPGRRWNGIDPEPDVLVQFGDAEVVFLAGREECFSQAEMTLIGTKGRVLYACGGGHIECQYAQADPTFPGYLSLGHPEPITNDLSHYQSHVVDALYQGLVNGSPLASDGKSALGTLLTVERIISSQ